jgi:hypothetical protein
MGFALLDPGYLSQSREHLPGISKFAFFFFGFKL